MHNLRVRYSECDLQGVAFNAHYLDYFDTSMTELWRAAYGSYQAMLDRGVDMVLAEVRVRFLRPARFDDELELAVVVTHLGRTSFRTRHTASCAGEVVAEAELRHVLVDRRTAAKTPLPGWLRDGIAPWAIAEPATADEAENAVDPATADEAENPFDPATADEAENADEPENAADPAPADKPAPA